MIVRSKENLIVITAETPEEQATIAVWAKAAIDESASVCI